MEGRFSDSQFVYIYNLILDSIFYFILFYFIFYNWDMVTTQI